jgi:hypothetical protein
MLVEIANRITKEKGVVYAVGKIQRAMELEGGYSSAAEIKVLTSSFHDLVRLCMLYGPMAIELIKPTEIRLSMTDAQQLLLSAAQISYDFTIALIHRGLKPEERIDLERKMKARAELGKKLLEEAKKDESKKEGK